jgi:hypothetical protein
MWWSQFDPRGIEAGRTAVSGRRGCRNSRNKFRGLERAFDMTLPSSQVEAIVQAIYDVAADRPRPASTPTADEKSTFRYRIDRWDAAGDNVLEHVAGLEDLAVAQAAYDRACRR